MRREKPMENAARIADFKPGLRDRATYATATSVSVLAGFLRKCWSAHRERRERARARAILHGMPDRELEDIGICRGEIEYLVSMQARSGDGVRPPETSARSAGDRAWGCHINRAP
jgi:uncharacterized protein YjiS (DUF1127 family)